MKSHLAADGRHAERIAVTADTSNHAGDKVPRPWMSWLPERQRVQTGDRPRAHCKDIAQDAADTGRGALIRLDEARVIVALHLEDHGEAVADVDDAGVFPWPLDHPGRLGRQPAQVNSRRLVRAMLVPHRREDSEFSERGFAAVQ